MALDFNKMMAEVRRERAEAAADFYSAVSYVVLAAPARVLAHPLLASLLPALGFGYGVADAHAARAALGATLCLAAAAARREARRRRVAHGAGRAVCRRLRAARRGESAGNSPLHRR